MVYLKKKLSLKIKNMGDPYFLELDLTPRSKDKSMEFPHVHPHYEIYVVLDHGVGYFVDGKYYALSEGDIVLVPPRVFHKGVYYQENEVHRLLLSFKLPDTDEFWKITRQIDKLFDLPCPVIRFPRNVTEDLVSILTDCFKEYNNDSFGLFQMYLASQSMRFLCQLKKDLKYGSTYKNIEMNEISHKVFAISSYIGSHYSESLSLDMLADKFYVSSCYLSRKFKEITGFSFVQYIQQVRITKAQEKLSSSFDSIQTISESCGFLSLSQFNRVFRSSCGMTPSEYRDKITKGEIVPFVEERT